MTSKRLKSGTGISKVTQEKRKKENEVAILSRRGTLKTLYTRADWAALHWV